MAADGSIVIDVLLDNKDVDKGLKNLGKSADRAALSIGKIVTALGLVALASSAINMVKSSLDGAIERYDTLNNFPRVLQQMGFDAEASAKAISRLSDGIQGLPTTLDDVARTAQRIAILTGDLDKAVETTLALNNAFLASGSDSAAASRGLEQYVQMLSKGEVDLQSWRTLQETMGVALNELANEFGFFGSSAQNALYDALKEGEITFNQLNTKLIELSNAQNGFAERALTASGGIKTAYTNMKTAVVRGLTTILESIDRVLEDNSLGSIEEIITNFGKSFNSVLVSVADNLPRFVDKLIEIKDAIAPYAPLIRDVALTIGILVGAIASANTIIGITTKSISLLSMAFSTTPIGAVIAAITLLVGALVYLWNTNEEFRDIVIAVWERIKEVFQNFMPLIDTIKEAFFNFVDSLNPIWESLKKLFESLMPILAAVGAIIGGVVVVALGIFISTISAVVSAIGPFINAIINILDVFINVFMAIVKFLTGDFSGAWEHWKKATESSVEFFKNLFTGIINFVSTFVKTIIDFFHGLYMTLVGNSIIPDMVNAIIEWFGNLGKWIIDKISNIIGSIVDGFKSALDFVFGIGEKFFDAGKNIVTSIADGIKAAINKVTDAISDVTAKVRDYLPFSPAKEGPLSDLNKLDFGGPIKDSLKSALPDVQKVLSNLLTIEPSVSAGAMGSGASTTNNYQRFGDIKLDARDLRHVEEIIEIFSRLQQTSRQGV